MKATDAGYPSVPVTGTVATPGDQNPANNSSTDTIQVLAARDATVELVAPPLLTVGATGQLTLRVRNVGTAPLAGATVGVALPPQLRFVTSATAGWICTPGIPVACADARQITGSDTLVIARAARAPVVNAPVTASVASAGDQNPANNSAAAAVSINPYVPGSYRLMAGSGQRRATTIRIGDKLTIRLPQPRRGARWRVRTQSTAVGSPFVTRASGRIQFRFTAKRSGRATLRFTRKAGAERGAARSWSRWWIPARE